MEKKKIYMAADHAGFYIKGKIKAHLEKKGFEVDDLSSRYKEGDDYPDHAFKLAEKVATHKNSVGILACGSGTGMAIAANKVKGVRAVEAYDEYSAKMSKIDNDANVICLRGRDFPLEKAEKIVDIWLATPFSKEERHDRRIRKIMSYEQSHLSAPRKK